MPLVKTNQRLHTCIKRKNINEYNLKDLRSNITMIDQEPTLISGSFRDNLDPSHIYTNNEL